MFSFATSDFLAEHPEIYSIWEKRNLPLNEELISIGFEKLVKGLEASVPYESDVFFYDYYLNAYLNGDDGYVNGDGTSSFDARVGLFLNFPMDLARLADALLSSSNITEKNLGTLDPKILGPHLAIEGVRQILCLAMFNESGISVQLAERKFSSSSCWAQAERDVMDAVELARKDKFIPFGDRKWDYKFFGYPCKGPGNPYYDLED